MIFLLDCLWPYNPILIQKMVNGGRVQNWICISFARNVQESVARGFCHELAQMCQTSGMVCAYGFPFLV